MRCSEGYGRTVVDKFETLFQHLTEGNEKSAKKISQNRQFLDPLLRAENLEI